MVVGTSFGATSPQAVSRIWKSAGNTDVIRLAQGPEVFHPKLYLFEGDDGTHALIGSANLTGAAYSENVEAMVRIRLRGEAAAEWHAQWKRWWDACKPLSRSVLSQYTRLAKRWADASVVQIARQSDLLNRSGQPSTNARKASKRVRLGAASTSLPDVLSLSFDAYIHCLRERYRRDFGVKNVLDGTGLQNGSYLSVISHARQIIREDGFPNPTDADRFGFVFGRRVNSLQLGSLRAVRGGWDVFKSGRFLEALKDRVGELSDAQSEEDVLEGARAVFDLIVAKPGLSHGVATRLLAIVRPDRLVSLNGGSIVRLEQFLGVRQGDLRTWSGYKRAVTLLWNAQWYNEQRPSNESMSRLWDIRVAIIDALVYSPKRS